MAISINSLVLSARNIYETTYKLNQETRLGHSSGEWRQSMARHVIPLGRGAFIAIEGMVEAHAFLKMRKPNYLYDVLSVDNEHDGDHWTDLVLSVDTLAELEAVADRLGGEVLPDRSAESPYDYYRRPDGYTIGFHEAPHYRRGRPRQWAHGLPSFRYYPDVPGGSGSQPVWARYHMVAPTGIKWIEFGGDEALLSEWMGVPKASDVIPVQFNGKEVGLWAVCIGRDGMDDIVIRRPTAAASVDRSKYRD